MTTAVVLFTRDLRVHDNPALHAACATADRVVPLFVLDPAVPTSARRHRFLIESLEDLRLALRRRGGDLIVRHGDPVEVAVTMARTVGASTVRLSSDVSWYATDRQRRLAEAAATHRLDVVRHDAVTVVPPGALRPTTGGSHYRVFTPYWRAWTQAPRRSVLPGPGSLRVPDGLDPGELPAVGSTVGAGEAGGLFPGGETVARRRLGRWTLAAARYDGLRDMLAVDGTSGLSPYLHFGCLSPLSAVRTVAAAAGPAGEAFIRQLCWRDFFHQVLATFPGLGRSAYRTGAVESWRDDADALAGWREGRTGIPIVDAGMRQLAAEGFMHNRARLITAAFLTKSLRLDWRHGARWYAESLVDADVANNAGNWQWVAGTGTDTKPFRRFNPVRQAQRFDPDGAYVRRWVPELAGIPGPAVHQPWLLPSGQRRRLGYERPLVFATEVS